VTGESGNLFENIYDRKMPFTLIYRSVIPRDDGCSRLLRQDVSRRS